MILLVPRLLTCHFCISKLCASHFLIINQKFSVCVFVFQDRTSGPEHGHAAASRGPSRNGPRRPSYWTRLHVWRAGRWVCDVITHTMHTSTLPLFHLLVVHFSCIHQPIRLQPPASRVNENI